MTALGVIAQPFGCCLTHTLLAYWRDLLQRYSQVLNLDLVTAVVKPSSGITRSDLPERLLHRLQQSFVGAPTKFSQNVLDLGERLLNGVQIWGVGWHEHKLGSSPLASMSCLILLGLCA